MSMNVYITAVRKAFSFNKKGEKIEFEDHRKFNAWQTRTKVTMQIIEMGEIELQIKEYKKYIYSLREVKTQPIYAEDDIFGEREPIRYEEYCIADEHLQDFEEWVSDMDEQGFTISIEMI